MSYLKHASLVFLMEHQLLLVERVEGSPGSGGFGFGQASLPAHQVDFHPRRCNVKKFVSSAPVFFKKGIVLTWQSFGACLALQSSCPNDLDL